MSSLIRSCRQAGRAIGLASLMLVAAPALALDLGPVHVGGGSGGGVNVGVSAGGSNGVNAGVSVGGGNGVNAGASVGGSNGVNAGASVGGGNGVNADVGVGGGSGVNAGVGVGGSGGSGGGDGSSGGSGGTGGSGGSGGTGGGTLPGTSGGHGGNGGNGAPVQTVDSNLHYLEYLLTSHSWLKAQVTLASPVRIRIVYLKRWLGRSGYSQVSGIISKHAGDIYQMRQDIISNPLYSKIRRRISVDRIVAIDPRGNEIYVLVL